jgi:hypothetical protein
MTIIEGDSADAGRAAVRGENSAVGGAGVLGQANASGAGGVIGKAAVGRGVYGESTNGTGVVGWSGASIGVMGESNAVGGEGVRGQANAAGAGGVVGKAAVGRGVYGESTNGTGVLGWSNVDVGVNGTSVQGIGVYGEGGRLAGYFKGDIEVTGDIKLSSGDCAEYFDIERGVAADPGTVMVLGENGSLLPSTESYDKRVVGVVAGAGDSRPAILLNDRPTSGERRPVALLGRVYCKVDADSARIEVGDMLTTSTILGHAMKATEFSRSFGAVIGKALSSLDQGRQLIPVLINLQ